MTAFIKSILGYTSNLQDDRHTQRGLPASWYSSKHMYELERRAIFSQKWMMITHKCRFTKAGDYARFTVASFQFFLCMDRKGNIGGFHNICRHRGYPLVHDESGNAQIPACKYHGWSYGTNGKLAKAPHFEGILGFEKDRNGLLPIHLHVDQLGFIWVNLDASETPTTPWVDDFIGVDTQKRFDNFDFSQYRFDHSWTAEGNYNWKTLADNYNECLHCKVAHPDVAGVADITVYKIDGVGKQLQHFTNIEGSSGGREVRIASTYHFPNSCMTVSPHFFYLMRCVPTSQNTCSMEYEVYRHFDASDAEFEHIDSMFKRILKEDKLLCNATQRNLDAGIYVNGELHPSYEQGPLYFQSLVKQIVTNHKAEEDKLRREIWPARQRTGASLETNSDMRFCASLDPEKSRGLDW